jgi:hypothetical protein
MLIATVIIFVFTALSGKPDISFLLSPALPVSPETVSLELLVL